MRELAIATAPLRDSKKWTQDTITWEELTSWVKAPASKKECGNYVLGTLRGTVRSKTTIVSRSALTLDSDSANADLVLEVGLLGHAALAHSTFQSTPSAPRLRIVLPLLRDVLPDEYVVLAREMMERLGEESFDPGSSQPERYMFRPSAKKPEWFQSWVMDGPLLDPDEILEDADFDLSNAQVPRRSRKRDPFAIDGVVGAFNRAYTIGEAIEQFELPYTAVDAHRWTLVGARSVAGLNQIAEGLVFSHHVTDPAWGMTCSAFDLVRVHLFGELDEKAPENTPVNRMPSHTAMAELATKDKRVTRELVGVDFANEMDELADELEETNWRDRLRWAKNGKIEDVIGNWDLIVAHDPLFTGLAYNELTGVVEYDGVLPWRTEEQGGKTFNRTDRAALNHHLERVYRLRPSRALVDELIDTAAQKRFNNPLKDYLRGLKWDGTPRVETCLPGVRPTKYTRMVARKALAAAAARVLEPGCKWDHTLVLFGAEGLGKSWWIEKLARGYTANLGRINDKDTLITMQRSWIMVADEGFSLRKADADATKEFLTKTEDIYRMPYDRESVAHKRHCVIWSTTNDDVFLRRQEGNRRFLIVKCEEAFDFDIMTQEYVDQLWAEAVELYRGGEELFLKDPEQQLARREREFFTEEDSLAGALQQWLDTLVPATWAKMSIDARKTWMANQAEGLVEGEHPITRTCTRQLWFEALGQTIEPKPIDLLAIGRSLKTLPGWEPVEGRHRVPGYGAQTVYARTESSEPDGFELL